MFKDEIRPAAYWLISTTIVVTHITFFLTKNNAPEKIAGNAYQLIIPLGILLLLCAVPRRIRDSLAHFKIKNPLPGSEAFSRWAKLDERISLDILKKKFGNLPRKKSKQQNSKWYAIYQTVKRQPEIITAHRKYILFRDLALIQACAILSWIPLASLFHPLFDYEWGTLVSFYCLFVLAARNTSIRFVQTTLSVACH